MDKGTFELKQQWVKANLEDINKEIIIYKDKIRNIKQALIILEKEKIRFEAIENACFDEFP